MTAVPAPTTRDVFAIEGVLVKVRLRNGSSLVGITKSSLEAGSFALQLIGHSRRVMNVKAAVVRSAFVVNLKWAEHQRIAKEQRAKYPETETEPA